MTALEVFNQSDGAVTRAYYAKLEERGPIGLIALNLFRASKTSTRAKNYRRRGKREAYLVKNWSLDNLCTILGEHSASRGIRYGWKEDPKTIGFEWVLYVDLPQGQVSFHSPARGQGPEYAGDWDGQKLSTQRILAFCDDVMNAKPGQHRVPGLRLPDRNQSRGTGTADSGQPVSRRQEGFNSMKAETARIAQKGESQ